jgi:DNA-binding NarL/FixJ family response regulator
LAGRSLEEAIRAELVWVEAMCGAVTRLTVIGDPLPLAPEVEHQAFKIVQEALNNVVTHARAATVRVGLIYDGGSMSVVIEDNGRGFDPIAAHGDHSALPTSCLGLHGMTSRATHLGGNLHIDSVPGWGTTIKAVLPHTAPDRGADQEPRWRILIAHDAPVVSAGLVRLLGIAEPAIQVGAEVHSANQLLEAYDLLRPDVVLMDLDMVHANTGLVSGMRELDADAVVVVLADNPTVDQVRSAKQSGVRGFINRRASGDSIARTIVAAGQGQALLEGEVFDRLLDSSEEKETDNLTTREREVCAMVIRGMADKQIARSLQISVKTVEKHVGSILRKTGARNRTMLVGMSGRAADTVSTFRD